MLWECNRLTFALRRLLAWEIGGYREKAEPKTGLFKDDPAAQAEETRLLNVYDLSEPWERATKTRYRETLTYLLWLETFRNLAYAWFEQVFCPVKPVNNTPYPDESVETLRWLDVGAKNWSYVAALPAFLMKEGVSDFALDGVELDPYRRYADFRTRGQAARAHSRAIPQACYHEGDVRAWSRPARIVTSFLPFVFSEPHLAWGLPAKAFRPGNLLEALLSLLEPGGLLLIVNQGEAETEEQAVLLTRAAECFPLVWQTAGQLPAPFIQYRYPRYGWICRKNE